MPLTLEDIRPFFQVIVYKPPPEFRLARLATAVLWHIRSENERTWGKFKQKRNSDLSDANPFLCISNMNFLRPGIDTRFRGKSRQTRYSMSRTICFLSMRRNNIFSFTPIVRLYYSGRQLQSNGTTSAASR
ncbi:MAG: hypothetical protein ABL984_03145 [Pyrinomonadaceae bacterium]